MIPLCNSCLTGYLTSPSLGDFSFLQTYSSTVRLLDELRLFPMRLLSDGIYPAKGQPLFGRCNYDGNWLATGLKNQYKGHNHSYQPGKNNRNYIKIVSKAVIAQ